MILTMVVSVLVVVVAAGGYVLYCFDQDIQELLERVEELEGRLERAEFPK